MVTGVAADNLEENQIALSETSALVSSSVWEKWQELKYGMALTLATQWKHSGTVLWALTVQTSEEKKQEAAVEAGQHHGIVE